MTETPSGDENATSILRQQQNAAWVGPVQPQQRRGAVLTGLCTQRHKPARLFATQTAVLYSSVPLTSVTNITPENTRAAQDTPLYFRPTLSQTSGCSPLT